MVLTVGHIDSERSFLLKGIDTFVEVARLLPDIPFCIAGFDQQRLSHLQKDFPDNLRVVGPVEHDQLSDFYMQTKVYCQLSRSESFGVALAEAMLHGCIPVVTNEGGMPEVIEKNGFIVRRDPNFIASLINKTIQKSFLDKDQGYHYIAYTFNMERRKSKLLEQLNK